MSSTPNRIKSSRTARLAFALVVSLGTATLLVASPAGADQNDPCYVTTDCTNTTAGGGVDTTVTTDGNQNPGNTGGNTNNVSGTPTGSGAPSAAGGTLPLTGGDVLGLAAIGLAALATGTFLVLGSRRREGMAEA